MSKAKRRKRSASEKILWLFSLLLVASMVISLIAYAIPDRASPTPEPTETPFLPTRTPQPTTAPTQALPAQPLPTATPTESVMGPLVPTEAPTVLPSPTVTPTLTVVPSPTTTPSAAMQPFRFAVCGDSRGNPSVYGRVLDSVVESGAQFLIHTGDLVNEGTEELWQEFQETMAGFSLPFFPVAGNHDALHGRLDGFLAYSGAPAAHYAFDRGLVHFTFADSHAGGIGASELEWLRQDLSSTQQSVKIVVLHHPPFDPDGTDHIMAYGNEQFMALMAEAGVDYVLAGHIHAHAQGERDGVVYVYTGGGGAPLYKDGHAQAFYHYLLFTVEGERVTFEVIRV